jgi:hypothetical protein
VVANLQRQGRCNGLLGQARQTFVGPCSWNFFLRLASLAQADLNSVLFAEDRYDQNKLQAVRGKYDPLMFSILGLSVWAQSQGEVGNKVGMSRRGDQFNSLTAASQPGTKPEGNGYTKQQLGYYLDPNEVSFVRPGLKFVIQNVIIGADNRIRVTYLITDNNGLPLDRLGVVTPGSESTSLVAAHIPKDQSQYVAYHSNAD